jgi:hypothetical protein
MSVFFANFDDFFAICVIYVQDAEKSDTSVDISGKRGKSKAVLEPELDKEEALRFVNVFSPLLSGCVVASNEKFEIDLPQ